MILMTPSTKTTWMPVTGYDSTNKTLTEATAFSGSFGYLSNVASSELTYTSVTGTTETTTTDAFTAKGLVSSTETTTEYGIYYHFYIDYMISKGNKLKVTAEAKVNGQTPSTDSPNIAQATRVGIMNATKIKVGTSDTDTKGTMTGATYETTGQEYLVAEAAETDYNLEGLKALGYGGTTEYKTNGKRLDTDGATITSLKADDTTTDKYTTTDGAFAYGSLSIYVWIDGTDYSCTNAIMKQKLDLTFNFTIK